MNLDRAYRLARAEMDAQGLTFWQLKWNQKKNTAGQCTYDIYTIHLSKHVIGLHDEDFLLDTIRHEMAHALVGPGHGHDVVWQKMAAQLGATPVAKYKSDVTQKNWVAYCPTGGHNLRGTERYRRPKDWENKTFTCVTCKRIGATRPVIIWKAL